MIIGGAGGDVLSNGGTAGTGGTGVSLNGATLTNKGTIIGGAGGDAPQSDYNSAYGGIGGVGVLVGAGSRLVNNKLIQGGTGGADIYVGNTGGDGVIIDGGVFTNAGTVAQGYGGVAQSPIVTNGDAVFFAGAGTLIAAPGAKFIGNVVSTLTSGSELELTGTSSTAFAGIGSQFIGINLISFAAGAARVLEGSTAAFGTGTIGGFAAHDTLVIDAFTAIPGSSYISTRFDQIDLVGGVTNFDFVNYTDLLAKDLEVTSSGGKTTLTGLGGGATNLASGAAEIVRAGGTGSGKINKGASEQILSGGTVTATTIAGGALSLLIGAKAAGTISFSGTGGILDIASATLPSASIAGFAAGDTIALDGIAYNPSDKVTVGTAGTVTIIAPGISYQLDITGATVGESDFKFSAGSLLTKGAAAKPAMAFLSPASAMAASAPTPGWALDDAHLFATAAYAPLAPQPGQGLTVSAHAAPGLSYGHGQTGIKAADMTAGPEGGLLRHAGFLS